MSFLKGLFTSSKNEPKKTDIEVTENKLKEKVESKEKPQRVHFATGSKTLQEEWNDFKVPFVDPKLMPEYNLFYSKIKNNSKAVKEQLTSLGWLENSDSPWFNQILRRETLKDYIRAFHIIHHNISLRAQSPEEDNSNNQSSAPK